MKKINQLFILLFLSILTVGLVGCSKQATKSTTKQETKTAKVTKSQRTTTKKSSVITMASKLKDSKKKQLVYAPFGDSLSVGLFANSKSQRFTTQFTNDISKQTGKKVTEAGISQVGKMASNLGLSQVNSIVAQDPDIITIEFGTNDAAGGATSSALNNYESSMNSIIKTLTTNTDAQIILMTTWSNNGGIHATADKQFDKIVYQLGQAYNLPVADLSTIWEGHNDVTGPSGTAINDFSTWGPRDNFHPNQLGHDQIAALLAKKLATPIK